MNKLIAPLLVLAAVTVGFALSWKQLEHRAPNSSPTAGAAPIEAPTPVVPARVPDIWLPDLTGKKQPLSKWTGRPLLINFWATWCQPCREETPLLESLRAQHAADKLEVIGIAVDFREPVAQYVKLAHLNYPILIAAGDGMVTSAFGVSSGLPFTVFVNAQGGIVAVKTGELHAQEAERLLARTLKTP